MLKKTWESGFAPTAREKNTQIWTAMFTSDLETSVHEKWAPFDEGVPVTAKIGPYYIIFIFCEKC
jgi:hypothetical protein